LACSRFDPREASLRAILVTGDYLSQAQRAYLGSFGGATVVNRYSLTEAVGGATELGGESDFRFDPQIVPDLDFLPRDGLHAAELRITVLYPFLQAQPLIRYKTDDVFSLGKGRPANHLAFNGRRNQCLFADEKRKLLIAGTD
jgi:phenylacetate-coenzyme A ligase PaaK-like adenylate-forming protein